MKYFTDTSKACGVAVFALALSACGDKTADSSVADTAAPGSSVSADNVTVPSAQSSDPAQQLAQSPGATQGQSSAPAAPSQGSTDQITLTDGSSVITTPVQNSTPERPSSEVADGSQPVQETLPVEPPDAFETDGGEPFVSLVARTDTGLNTSGTSLVWEAANVDTCEASGAWEGALNANGELGLEHNKAGDLTYVISCRGTQGTAMAMVTVTVESTALAWEPPAKNTNGSEITDLAGYNLYFGTEPGRYTDVRPVRDASQTELELPVEPGTYYLAMTAYDMSGNESELSNEITRVVY